LIPITTFAGRHVAVFGLGSSGNVTALALMAGGAIVSAWDDGEGGRESAAKAGIALVDLSAADWSGFCALVLSPGVPLTHPEPHWTVHKARDAGIEVIGDIELFCRERNKLCPEAPFIAITGTNGKSTTTALIAHILREAGRDVQMGGNIGVPILALEPLKADRYYVIEMSSFQIDLTPSVNPTVGVLLNITPDHLDRHGPADDLDLAMKNYAGIKERLVLGASMACVGVDDEWCRAIAEHRAAGHRPTITFAVDQPINAGWKFTDGIVWAVMSSERKIEVAKLDEIPTLRGRHNAQNALAAVSAVQEAVIKAVINGPAVAFDLAEFDWQAALSTYPGLPHRMEEIGRVGDVLFINDSKATNADSTEKALLSFVGDIYWILGGKPKEGGIATLAPYFERIAKAYLIGAASDEFAATFEGKVPYERCGTLEVAVARAAGDAAAFTSPGTGEVKGAPVVLLSPACASYDQFKNFEVRGDAFRALVTGLPGFTPRGKST